MVDGSRLSPNACTTPSRDARTPTTHPILSQHGTIRPSNLTGLLTRRFPASISEPFQGAISCTNCKLQNCHYFGEDDSIAARLSANAMVTMAGCECAQHEDMLQKVADRLSAKVKAYEGDIFGWTRAGEINTDNWIWNRWKVVAPVSLPQASLDAARRRQYDPQE